MQQSTGNCVENLGKYVGPGGVGAKVGKLLDFEELKSDVDGSDANDENACVCEKRIVADCRQNPEQRKPM